MGTSWIERMLIFAEGDGAAPKGPPPSPWDGIASMLPLLAILFIFFYFIMIRPQGKERQKRQEMLNNLKKNDRVLTSGGIFGVVVNVHREANEVVLKVDETTNTKLRVALSSIALVTGGGAAEETKPE